MSQKKQPAAGKNNRRDFIRTSSAVVAGAAVVGSLNIARAAHAYGGDEIKIGLIGCGGRGTGAAVQAMNTKGPVKLVAMADAFADRVQQGLRSIKGAHPEKFDVPAERQFVGLDAYKGVIESDCDLVILATPPGFRPLHFEAAVKAGKHIFMEKPVATDAPGVRRVLEAGEMAKDMKKDLLVQVGLQRRHEKMYKDVIAKIHDGAIGDIVCTRVYWNSGGVWVRERQENWSELEYQTRNWYYFNWLCGDHICEQHIHNLDVGCWVHNDYPVSAHGMGGRQVRTGKQFGEIYDHHAVEYTFADGSKMFSQCQHADGIWNAVSEFAHGTNGSADLSGGKIFNRKGEVIFQSSGGGGHQEEHHDLFRDIREGKRPNEAEYGAKSTMVAILGRMCTYSGKQISWNDAINSQLALANFDELKTWDQEAPVKPNGDGTYHIPVPGQEKVL